AAFEFYVLEHRRRIKAAFAACIGEGRSFDEILQIVTAKANTVWVRAIGEAERGLDGGVKAAHGAIQDVSELVAAGAQSESLPHRLRETLEHISDAFFTPDEAWRFGLLNAQAETVLGRHGDDLLGQR